jgi:hypothetical protein
MTLSEGGSQWHRERKMMSSPTTGDEEKGCIKEKK